MTEAKTPAIAVKPFKDYPDLVDILESRGMIIGDRDRAIRKIAQVGYYHLSGYWHSSRSFWIERNERGKVFHHLDEFQADTSFEAVFQFYLMDKSLRVLMGDALERIEIHLRTIIAHELGRHDPLAHLDRANFVKSALVARPGDPPGTLPLYEGWLDRHDKLLAQSHEESIRSHLKAGKPIPIWVASEAWDFGTISKLYSILIPGHQDSICERLGVVERNVVDNWLINLNVVRNRCAHHARLSNRPNPRVLMLPRRGYFNELNLDLRAKERLYGLICVVWFLLKAIGPNSQWLTKVADVIDTMPRLPGLTPKSIGFPDEGFPRGKFSITSPPRAREPLLEDVCAATLEAFAVSRETILSLSNGPNSPETRKRFTDEMLEMMSDI